MRLLIQFPSSPQSRSVPAQTTITVGSSRTDIGPPSSWPCSSRSRSLWDVPSTRVVLLMAVIVCVVPRGTWSIVARCPRTMKIPFYVFLRVVRTVEPVRRPGGGTMLPSKRVTNTDSPQNMSMYHTKISTIVGQSPTIRRGMIINMTFTNVFQMVPIPLLIGMPMTAFLVLRAESRVKTNMRIVTA